MFVGEGGSLSDPEYACGGEATTQSSQSSRPRQAIVKVQVQRPDGSRCDSEVLVRAASMVILCGCHRQLALKLKLNCVALECDANRHQPFRCHIFVVCEHVILLGLAGSVELFAAPRQREIRIQQGGRRVVDDWPHLNLAQIM